MKEFEEEFEPEELEIYALLRSKPCGASRYLENYLNPLVYIEAMVDCRMNVMNRREGILTWLVPSEQKNWRDGFKQYGIYKLLVKKAKFKVLDENRRRSWNNRYLVLQILEADGKQKELEELVAYLKEPKYIHTQLGDLLLNRQYKWYEMKTPKYEFILEVDEDSTEACDTALAVFKKQTANISGLDQKLRAYVADAMLDMANDWLDNADEAPVTADEFARRITLDAVTFRNDGSIEAYYDDDDIFWGHCIVVNMDKDGNMENADIAG